MILEMLNGLEIRDQEQAVKDLYPELSKKLDALLEHLKNNGVDTSLVKIKINNQKDKQLIAAQDIK